MKWGQLSLLLRFLDLSISSDHHWVDDLSDRYHGRLLVMLGLVEDLESFVVRSEAVHSEGFQLMDPHHFFLIVSVRSIYAALRIALSEVRG